MKQFRKQFPRYSRVCLICGRALLVEWWQPPVCDHPCSMN